MLFKNDKHCRLLGLLTLIVLPVAIATVFATDPIPETQVTLPSHDEPSQEPVDNQERLVAQAAVAPSGQNAGNSNLSPDPNVTMATVAAAPQATPSQNVTINLIHRLVQRGVLTQQDADELIKQAEDDAARARLAAAKTQEQKPRSDDGDPSLFPIEPAPLTSATTTAQPAAGTEPVPQPNASSEEDTMHIHYVPDVVKEQLRDELRQEVMEKARDENWAAPRSFPDWVLRFTPFADIRMRYEGDFYPDGNDTTGSTFQFVNFNAINTGSPYDLTSKNFPPEFNTSQDRDRFRIRVRVGAQLDLEDGFTMGLRIATGETDTPVSPNQSLGAANNAQGGDFSKYAIWLDRAFVRYELGGKPSEDFQVNLGRFDNPFFTTSGIMWYDDLGFDGVAVSGKYKIHEGITPFAVAGAFPIFDTDLNFSSNRPDKFSSEDKYLLAGQMGTSLRFNKDFSAKIAGAFYDFENIEGKLSSPFVPLSSADQGNTDDSRPAFAQHGNTYFPIRDILATADNDFGTINQFQYFGLATPFRVVDVAGTLEYAHFDPFHLKLFGEYVENVAFDYNDVNSKALNNRGPNLPNGQLGNFSGGNAGWIIGLTAGSPAFKKPLDWNVGINYRYIESDATVDGFVDSDFGGILAGTNLKGYTVFGSLALTSHVSIFLRWMSADAIAGPPLRNDTLQFDFNARF